MLNKKIIFSYFIVLGVAASSIFAMDENAEESSSSSDNTNLGFYLAYTFENEADAKEFYKEMDSNQEAFRIGGDDKKKLLCFITKKEYEKAREDNLEKGKDKEIEEEIINNILSKKKFPRYFEIKINGNYPNGIFGNDKEQINFLQDQPNKNELPIKIVESREIWVSYHFDDTSNEKREEVNTFYRKNLNKFGFTIWSNFSTDSGIVCTIGEREYKKEARKIDRENKSEKKIVEEIINNVLKRRIVNGESFSDDYLIVLDNKYNDGVFDKVSFLPASFNRNEKKEISMTIIDTKTGEGVISDTVEEKNKNGETRSKNSIKEIHKKPTKKDIMSHTVEDEGKNREKVILLGLTSKGLSIVVGSVILGSVILSYMSGKSSPKKSK